MESKSIVEVSTALAKLSAYQRALYVALVVVILTIILNAIGIPDFWWRVIRISLLTGLVVGLFACEIRLSRLQKQSLDQQL